MGGNFSIFLCLILPPKRINLTTEHAKREREREHFKIYIIYRPLSFCCISVGFYFLVFTHLINSVGLNSLRICIDSTIFWIWSGLYETTEKTKESKRNQIRFSELGFMRHSEHEGTEEEVGGDDLNWVSGLKEPNQHEWSGRLSARWCLLWQRRTVAIDEKRRRWTESESKECREWQAQKKT